MAEEQDLFDFGDEGAEMPSNSEKVHTNVDTDDTMDDKIAPKKAAAKRSGRKSGKVSGSVPRQQKRVPMHQRQPLDVRDRDPNYEYRVVNDTPGRIDRFKLAGWEVDEKTSVGDKVAGKASSMGSASTAPVGRGQTGVVMKIPKELYIEDQKAKQREVDRTEEAMTSEATEEINRAAGNKNEARGDVKIG